MARAPERAQLRVEFAEFAGGCRVASAEFHMGRASALVQNGERPHLSLVGAASNRMRSQRLSLAVDERRQSSLETVPEARHRLSVPIRT